MSITEQAAEPESISAQAIGLAFPDVPGFKGQGWSTQETMMVVRWLFANPAAWDQAMDTARAYPGNPHTVADTLHETIVPRSELDAIVTAGGDPARVNWLEIGHELIERRDDPRPETIGAQLAAGRPKEGTISGQLDLSAASRQKAHDTASATARAHARADEARDGRGRWAAGTGDDIGRSDEAQRGGRKPATGKDVTREWRQSKDVLVRKHLNQASAHLDAGDYAAAGDELKHAGSMAGMHGDDVTSDRLDEMGRSLSEESRTNAAVVDFAAKGAKAVTGLLGAGHNDWNGKIDLFNAADQPTMAACLNWDGTMQLQRELAQKMRDSDGGPVDDTQPYAVVLHELIHGAVPEGGTHAMQAKAYQNPTVATVEEGFTELGTAHHAPEFFAKMGVGDRPTKYTAFEGGHPKVNPVYASTKAAVFSKLADTERALSADPRGPQQQAAQAARRAVQSLNDDNLPGAEDDLAELRHLGDPDVTQAAKSIQAGLDKMQAAGFAARATMSEYAKRLRDPDRIAKGDAWRHYGWQTAAAQSWVQDAAKAEGKGPKSPRVRDLADEINREGVGGKVPAMVRQVIRAAGGNPDDFGWEQPSLALGNLIKEQWPQGPDGAQSSPWASAVAVARKFVPLMT